MAKKIIPPFGIRMEPKLKNCLWESARANRRSLNGEIVLRLEKSIEKEKALNELGGEIQGFGSI